MQLKATLKKIFLAICSLKWGVGGEETLCLRDCRKYLLGMTLLLYACSSMTLLPYPWRSAIVSIGHNHAFTYGVQIKPLHLKPLGALKSSSACLWPDKWTRASIKCSYDILNVNCELNLLQIPSSYCNMLVFLSLCRFRHLNLLFLASMKALARVLSL